MKFNVSVFFFLFCRTLLYSQNITTIAGNQIAGFSGDGGPALMARLNLDINSDIQTDVIGNIYFIDKHRIRKINLTGTINTIVGTGIAGFSGDNGLAINAQLDSPSNILIDSLGNIYISDQGNQRIRKVNQSGIITTFAGNGSVGFNGDGGLAIAASLNNPRSLAFDVNGDLLISDNYRIRKINSSGIINTIAGNGNSVYSGDGGLAIDAGFFAIDFAVDNTGNIYIADFPAWRIRKIDTLGVITTIAGNGNSGFSGDGGNALSAQIIVVSLTIDSLGNIYFVGNHKIRKIDINGIITAVAGNGSFGYSGDNGPAIASQISASNICTDISGTLYLAETYVPLIRKIGDCVPIEPQICMVTVDSISLNNEIFWDKSAYLNADTFYIYRDTANYAFGLIGKVPASALSMYTDTNRSLYNANGDPNVTYWRYKIAYHDSCSNSMSTMSPWHQSIYQYNLGGLFLWNHYQIEGQTTPIPGLSNYLLKRDNSGNSINWVTAATASASSNNVNDPQFASYQNTAEWRLETQWNITCGSSTGQPYVNKSISNNKNGPISLQNINNMLPSEFIIYPNPNKGSFSLFETAFIGTVFTIFNSFGQAVYQTKIEGPKTEINLNHCTVGVYFFKVENEVSQPKYGKIVLN
jgi:hypothetical protein